MAQRLVHRANDDTIVRVRATTQITEESEKRPTTATHLTPGPRPGPGESLWGVLLRILCSGFLQVKITSFFKKKK